MFTVKSCSWGKEIIYLLNLWPFLMQTKLLKKHVLLTLRKPNRWIFTTDLWKKWGCGLQEVAFGGLPFDFSIKFLPILAWAWTSMAWATWAISGVAYLGVWATLAWPKRCDIMGGAIWFPSYTLNLILYESHICIGKS